MLQNCAVVMAKQKVNINDTSIKSAVTTDPKKAICEYIWNGYDAGAVHVWVNYEANELGSITALSVKDDGTGINRSLLHDTFGTYQDSIKKRSFQWSSQVKGHRGKGRYAFNCFATRADWVTIYREGDHLFRHSISINAGENDHFNDHSDEGTQTLVHDEGTGTIVSFSNVTLPKEFFVSTEFWNYLRKEFAVFLKLNEKRGKSLFINGVELDYSSVIAEDDTKHFNVVDDNDHDKVYSFDATFIRWHEKMKENYSIYYLDENEIEHFEKTTSLNNKDTDFHHSVYVVSSYFNNFGPTKDAGIGDDQESLDTHSLVEQFLNFDGIKILKTEKDKVFKELHKKVKEWLNIKLKNFIQDVAGEELWSKFENSGVVIEPSNDYEKPLYYDLKETVKGIYSVQPRIFVNIGNDQAKALVGCLKLLLQTDKREDVLFILESITKMTDEERHRLVEILIANSKEIENIIIELKRPTVKLGEIELSQIKNYMKLIYKEPQFNDSTARWTFILVGKELDGSSTIETEWETNKVWGKKGLVLHVDTNTQHYEIFVKTWSTIFAEFEMRHNFLMKRLNFKRKKLSAEYKTKDDLHKIVDEAKGD